MTKCPQCGYEENLTQPIQSIYQAATYVDEKTGKVVCVMNSNEAKISVPANKKTGEAAYVLVRQDLWKAPTTNTPTPVIKK